MLCDRTNKKKKVIPHIYVFLQYSPTDLALMKVFQLWDEERDVSKAAIRPTASRVARCLAADVILLHSHTLKQRTDHLLIKACPLEAYN